MLGIFIKTGKILSLLLIITIVIATIIVSFITYRFPQTTISFIETYLVPTPTISQTKLTGLGILGDSQSDEYRADDNRGANYPTTTLNWVEILVQERNINIGEWGVWQEPRRSGYAYNWARTGATAASM
ncbi:MAG TPA: hypothetical protein PLS49_00390, partial [Candidatus Woesebacteria bacterium]|nr:hypothetical protein [Candidatus Woesebacteria bacterium]